MSRSTAIDRAKDRACVLAVIDERWRWNEGARASRFRDAFSGRNILPHQARMRISVALRALRADGLVVMTGRGGGARYWRPGALAGGTVATKEDR